MFPAGHSTSRPAPGPTPLLTYRHHELSKGEYRLSVKPSTHRSFTSFYPMEALIVRCFGIPTAVPFLLSTFCTIFPLVYVFGIWRPSQIISPSLHCIDRPSEQNSISWNSVYISYLSSSAIMFHQQDVSWTANDWTRSILLLATPKVQCRV
jgi:hypothetical protein